MNGNTILEAVIFHDSPEMLLVGAVCDHDNLEAEVGVVLRQLKEDVGKELAAFLNGVKA